MIRWLILLLMSLVIAANILQSQHKADEHIEQIITQYDCYLVGMKNPGAYNSQPVYRCGDAVIPRDRLVEKLPLTSEK